jgi:peptide/nickel transport system substrate-binding protein
VALHGVDQVDIAVGEHPLRDALLDQALQTTDPTVRNRLWVAIDKVVMESAGIWGKGLLYRPPNLTNVFVTDGFGMYDYLSW